MKLNIDVVFTNVVSPDFDRSISSFGGSVIPYNGRGRNGRGWCSKFVLVFDRTYLRSSYEKDLTI